MLDRFFKKESPLLSMMGMGGGKGGFALKSAGGGAASASGGDVNGLEPGNGYKYHTFTSSGSLVVTADGPAEVLIVAGGGHGQSTSGHGAYAGGGAGGMVIDTGFELKAGTYTVVIGGENTDSSITHPEPQQITAVQGGNSCTSAPSGFGGSGGGISVPGHGSPVTKPGATGTQPFQSHVGGSPSLLQYGNPGGVGSTPGRYAASGGGGAGAVGGDNYPGHSSGRTGYGGNGVQLPAFTGPQIGVPSLAPHNGYFAGGGGGYDNSPFAGGVGGLGGGSPSQPATMGSGHGATNTGGGGARGGNGGSGIVVFRYAV